MLTHRHLALIRAALQFFDEEMSPHGPEVSEPYFEDPLEEPLTVTEVTEFRAWLRRCELRYACCDSSGSHLISPELTASLPVARSLAIAHSGRAVAVLLGPQS